MFIHDESLITVAPTVAASVPARGDEPLVRQHLKVPHKSASAHTIVTAARGMLDALMPYRDYLAECTIDVTRLDRLEHAIAEYEHLSRVATESSGDHAKGTRELRAILSRAHASIRGIDGAIGAEHRDLASLWNGARRMHKRIGRPLKRSRMKHMQMPAR